MTNEQLALVLRLWSDRLNDAIDQLQQDLVEQAPMLERRRWRKHVVDHPARHSGGACPDDHYQIELGDFRVLDGLRAIAGDLAAEIEHLRGEIRDEGEVRLLNAPPSLNQPR